MTMISPISAVSNFNGARSCKMHQDKKSAMQSHQVNFGFMLAGQKLIMDIENDVKLANNIKERINVRGFRCLCKSLQNHGYNVVTPMKGEILFTDNLGKGRVYRCVFDETDKLIKMEVYENAGGMRYKQSSPKNQGELLHTIVPNVQNPNAF